MGMREMAQKVAARLEKLGAKVRRDSSRAMARRSYWRDRRRTAHVDDLYNHYDVQPPEPLELWDSPPFDAAIRDGKLFARGVADNKGNLVCRIQAVEAYLATLGKLPLKIKFVFEGEEEIGSIHLPQFVAENRELLQNVDGCLVGGGLQRY